MKIKKLGASKTLLQFSDNKLLEEIFISYETPVAARLKNGDCIRTEKQITQYFSWVKDKNKIKNVSQSYLDNLLGA